MAIILEGFDNSGKSSLASKLGLEVVHPGPRPKTDAEELKCLEQQAAMLYRRGIVMDRCTAISQACYSGTQHLTYHDWVVKALTRAPVVIVYCRPPIEVMMDFSTHQVKSYDDEKFIKYLQDNGLDIIARYDAFMARYPHIKYDYTAQSRLPEIVL